jgi:hypothetical protein
MRGHIFEERRKRLRKAKLWSRLLDPLTSTSLVHLVERSNLNW